MKKTDYYLLYYKIMKAMLFLLIITLLPLQVFGDMETKIDQNRNPILNQFSEDGFVDCVFKINDHGGDFYRHCLASGNYRYGV